MSDSSDGVIDPEELDLADPLDALTEMLVSDEPQAVAFLERLLAETEGKWCRVRPMLGGWAAPESALASLESSFGVTLHVHWKGCPPIAHGKRGALIVFYSPEWNGVANTVLIDREALHGMRN